MKKLLAIISIAVLAAACSKEPVPTPEPEPVVEKVYVKFSANLDEDTKATIAQMKWEAGDKITIWVKSELDKAIYAGDEVEIKNIETGIFEGMIASPNPEGDTFYAAYKASSIQKVNNTYEPVFNIPASQTTAAAGATKAMLKGQFTGLKENLNFTGDNAMKAATAKLKITVSEGVTSVVFAGMSGETITEGSKTLTYSGAAATDIEFIVPAMTFSNGYKVTYTNSRGTMYQSYSGEKSFEDGKARTINCTFVPFSISCGFQQVPMSSYSYYLKGDAASITKANSNNFLTIGEIGAGGTGPDEYDEDAQGHFTGNIEHGTAKVVINGASSAVLPSMTVSERGYYVTYLMRNSKSSNDYTLTETKIVVVNSESTPLSKDLTWSVFGANESSTSYGIDYTLGKTESLAEEEKVPQGFARFYAGEVKINPYIKVDGKEYCMYERGSEGKVGETVYVTGLPHKSNHKDLWYIAKSPTTIGTVSRRQDDKLNWQDMFYDPNKSQWTDYCVRSRSFNIPASAEINARVIMHGVTWAPHTLNAYFWFDATNHAFGLHKDVAKGDKDARGSEKLNNLSDCDAYVENDESGDNYSYQDLGTGGRYGVINPGKDIITLTSTNAAASVYLWIYRGSTGVLFDYPGYWCNYVKVQYAAPSNN